MPRLSSSARTSWAMRAPPTWTTSPRSIRSARCLARSLLVMVASVVGVRIAACTSNLETSSLYGKTFESGLGTNSAHGARRSTRPAPPGARGVPRRSWPDSLRDPCRRPPGEFRLPLGEHVGLGQPPAVPHVGKDVAHAAEPVLPGRARRPGAVREHASRPHAPEHPALFKVLAE